MIIESSHGLYLSRTDKLEESNIRNDNYFKIIYNPQHNNLYKIRSEDIKFGRDSFLFIAPDTNHQQLHIHHEKTLIEIHSNFVQELCESFNETPVTLFQNLHRNNEQLLQLHKLRLFLNSPISNEIKSNSIDYFITQFTLSHFVMELPDFAEVINRSYTEQWSLESLAENIGYSKYHLIRKFNQQFGMSPIEYLNYRRIQAACHLLLNSDATITHITYEVGFQSTSQLNAWFRKFLLMSPKEFKAKYRNSNH